MSCFVGDNNSFSRAIDSLDHGAGIVGLNSTVDHRSHGLLLGFAKSSEQSYGLIALQVSRLSMVVVSANLVDRLNSICILLLTTMLVGLKIWQIMRRLSTKRRVSHFTRDNGCVRTRKELPQKIMSSIRNKIDLLKHKGGDLLDDVFAEKYRTYGETHALYDSYGVAKVVHTIDPVNVNALLSSKSHDYRGPKNRKGIMYPLAQDGILTTEGAEWAHHRKTVQRLGFRGAKDCSNVESDVQLLFEAIGQPRDADGWTGEVDLLDLFIRMALDMSLQHLFGTTANSQLIGMSERASNLAAASGYLTQEEHSELQSMSYNEAYEVIRYWLAMRSKLGSKYWLADSPNASSVTYYYNMSLTIQQYRQACRVLNDFTEKIINDAIRRSEESGDAKGKPKNFSLVDSLVREYSSIAEIREVVMDVFMAGQNMTGTILAWLFAELEKHPAVFMKIRAEVSCCPPYCTSMCD